jgi:hypothetical protein
MIGVRGLNPPMKQCKVKVSLPGYMHGVKSKNKEQNTDPIEFECSNEEDPGNINMCQLVTFVNVELPEEVVFLPLLKFEFSDMSWFGGGTQFSQATLIPHAKWVESNKRANAMLAYNRPFTPNDTIEQIPVDYNRH